MSLATYWLAPYREEQITRYRLDFGLRLRIAVIADLHAATRFMPAHRIARIVDMTLAESPDVILLPGDFLAEATRFQTPIPLAQVTRELARLTAPLGVWASLGNHDWWDDPAFRAGADGPDHLIAALAEIGIGTLRNTSLDLGPCPLAGLDSQAAFWSEAAQHMGAHDLNAALATTGPDRPLILMAHEPAIFSRLPERPILQISGHTHGGQCRIFGQRPVLPSQSGGFAYGVYRRGAAQLVVSGGLGCSKAPLRFGCIPEIVIIETR